MVGRHFALLAVLCILIGGCDTRRGSELAPIPAAPQKIVFASDRDESHSEIYIMEVDGTGVTRLTVNEVPDAAPLLSPDGSKITFRRELNPASVFVMNANGSTQIGLAPGKRAEWSPDGSKLALIADSLCMMNSDATGRRCFGLGASFAAWKPDGTKLAYVSTGLGGQQQNDIYIINPDGSAPVRITNDGVDRTSLAWSPDGTKIMYSTSQTVYVIHTDGSGLSSPCEGHGARFSPDGQRIIFVTSIFDGNEEIYTVRVDGTDPRNLTQNPADDHDPDWGPRR